MEGSGRMEGGGRLVQRGRKCANSVWQPFT